MTFRQKNAAATLLILILTYAGYGFWLFAQPRLRAEVFTAMIVLVIVSVVLAIVWAVAYRIYSLVRRVRDEAADERDRRVEQKSARNGYWVILSTLWAVPFMVLLPFTHVLVANVALGILLVAEIVHYGSILYYYRRGA